MKAGWFIITPWKKKYLGEILPPQVKRCAKLLDPSRKVSCGDDIWVTKYAIFIWEIYS